MNENTQNTETLPHPHALPVWVRSPKGGNEFYTGFSRAKLYELAGDGKIISAAIREDGAEKGIRLFHLQSILDFIESHVLTPNASPSEPNQPAN